MYVEEILSLTCGVLCMAAPCAQAIKTISTKNVVGLSISSYMLMIPLGALAVLIGVQYRIYTFMALNAIILACNLCILYLISWRAFLALVGSIILFVVIADALAPWFVAGMLTTRWAEPTAFVQGFIGASAFVFQVRLTRKKRAVSALSLMNLVLFAAGMVVALALALLLRNWSMLFWNAIIFLSLCELLRLKISIEYFSKTSPPLHASREIHEA